MILFWHWIRVFHLEYIIAFERVDISLVFGLDCSLEPYNDFVLVDYSITTEKRQTIMKNYESIPWKKIR